MNKNLRLILGGAMLFLLIAACVIPGQAIPSAPTIDQNLVQTSIAGTVQAAQTQTAVVPSVATDEPAGMTGTAIEQASDGTTKYTDYDGGFGWPSVPLEINTVADLRLLAPMLAERGYAQADIDAIFGGNWTRLLENTLPA